MARRTKKVGVAGKFGPRYGVKSRRIYADIMNKKNKKYPCPRCNYVAVRRTDTAVWVCKHCGYKFAGGAYVPRTSIVGKIFSSSRRTKYDYLKENLTSAENADAGNEEE